MTAVDLNIIRKNIEKRLIDEMQSAPPITVVFNNIPFKPLTDKIFVLSEIEFTQNQYIDFLGNTNKNNIINGQLNLNIFSKVGIGVGESLTVATRLRNLFNRINVDNVFYEAVNGPAVLQNGSPEGYLQSRMTIDFQVFEEL
tara:strand:- start:642 stop:1067 length:426 start_codon:yes stop_codon:yes gene_type:complete